MKSKFTLLLMLMAVTASTFAQQITNAGFESWTSPLAPDSWSTYEEVFGAPLGLVTKDTVSKVQGTASVKVKTDSINAGPQGSILLAGLVSLGNINYSPTSNPPFSFSGIPFSFKPDTIFFSYKYTPSGADTAGMFVIFSTGGTPTLAGGVDLPSTAGNWANIFIPTTNDLAQLPTPDSLVIQYTSSFGGAPVEGSTLNVDAIRFGYVNAPTLVEELDNNLKVSVFPNPANALARIQLSENMDGSVMVFDMNGRVVTHELFFGNGHVMNTSTWANGVYSYTILNQQGVAKAKGLLNVAH